MLASESALLHGPELFLRWGCHSMSSCDGASPIVVEPVQFIPTGSPIPHVKAPANPTSQGTSPITGLVYAAICGTKKYLSIFFRAGGGGPERRDGSLTLLGFRFALPERCGVIVAAATSALCRGTSQQNIAFQMFLATPDVVVLPLFWSMTFSCMTFFDDVQRIRYDVNSILDCLCQAKA